jgi:hypothetical protein
LLEDALNAMELENVNPKKKTSFCEALCYVDAVMLN